jgi:hypothetical protein
MISELRLDDTSGFKLIQTLKRNSNSPENATLYNTNTSSDRRRNIVDADTPTKSGLVSASAICDPTMGITYDGPYQVHDTSQPGPPLQPRLSDIEAKNRGLGLQHAR